MLQGYIAKKWGNKMFEDDIAKIVKKHSFCGAVIMALPTFGLGLIIYCFILWHMYSALCKKCNIKLRFNTIIVGIIVNLVITAVISFLLNFLPVIGWLGTGFIVYLQYYLSGKMYIETLKKMDSQLEVDE